MTPDGRDTIMARNTARNQIKKNELKSKTEERLQKAVAALKEGTFKYISVAARHFKVLYDTLCRRYQEETTSHTEGHKWQQLMTTAQEETLCEWIKFMGMVGHPLTKAALRVKVAAISPILQEQAKKTGKPSSPGKNWSL